MAAASKRNTTATIRYFSRNPPPEALENGVHAFGEGQGVSREEYKRLRQLVTTPHEMVIEDAREVEGGLGSWDLEKNGFTVVEAPPPPPDWLDRDKVYAEYFPKLIEMTKTLTGAKGGFALPRNGFIVRKENPVVLTEAYARFAHTDCGPDIIPSYRRMLIRHGLPEEEAMSCDICMYNFWHPIENPAYRDPLCLIDAASVQMATDTCKYKYKNNPDMKMRDGTPWNGKKALAATLDPNAVMRDKDGNEEGKSLGVGVMHSPTHRWVYIPDQKPEEAYLFKQYDTRTDAAPTLARCTFHNSFHDPFYDSNPDTPPRRSCEFRFVMYYPKNDVAGVPGGASKL